MAQAKQESFYKRLGTNANISQRRIKEKYINAVKQHPPETDPGRFEEIREAYETLKDPVKRKQYDMSRKYGGQIDDMFEKAKSHLNRGNEKKAEEMYEQITAINPAHLAAQSELLRILVARGDVQAARQPFDQILENTRPADYDLSLGHIYSLYARILMENDHAESAYDLFEEAWGAPSLDRESRRVVAEGLSIVCLQLEKDERALEVIEQALPLSGEETFDDWTIYAQWLRTVGNAEYWSLLGKVKSRFRHFIGIFEDEEEKEELMDILIEDYDKAYHNHYFRIAEVFMELVQIIDPADPDIKEDIKAVKKLSRLEKQMNRLSRDEKIYPMVIFHAERLFNDITIDGGLDTYLPPIPNNYEDAEDWYAAGIMQLKKKYPVVYSYFKPKWDELFAETTKHFNRERKRALKKLKV